MRGRTDILIGPLVHIETDIYEIWYSEEFLEPVEVHYTVPADPDGKNVSREGIRFHSEDDIKTSTDKHYANNEYDKGHMAPAADFNDNLKQLKETFSYINCALQFDSLNQGPWKMLEDYERELAESHEVYIEITVEFKGEKRIKEALVPSGFYKTIYSTAI